MGMYTTAWTKLDKHKVDLKSPVESVVSSINWAKLRDKLIVSAMTFVQKTCDRKRFFLLICLRKEAAVKRDSMRLCEMALQRNVPVCTC